MADDLVSEVSKGDRRQALIAIRDFLARELAAPEDARSISPLAKELRAVLAEIDALPIRGKESTVDEVAAKRANRRAQAAAAPGDPVRDKRGS